jgi:hypothetical protein
MALLAEELVEEWLRHLDRQSGRRSRAEADPGRNLLPTVSDVRARVAQYQGEKEQWFEEIFLPLLEPMSVELITWERIINDMKSSSFGEGYRHFYEKCSSLVPRLTN